MPRGNWDDSFIFFFFLGPYPQHVEVPRLRVESKLQLPAYATATATWDTSHVCNLHHSSRQCRIFNPRSKARDGTRNLMVPSRIPFRCATTGTPPIYEGSVWSVTHLLHKIFLILPSWNKGLKDLYDSYLDKNKNKKIKNRIKLRDFKTNLMVTKDETIVEEKNWEGGNDTQMLLYKIDD